MDVDEATITIGKIQGDYAKGGVGGSGGGGIWFMAKVGGVWKLVWAGNGTILCKDLETYPKYPTDFIPECYNGKTGKIVKR